MLNLKAGSGRIFFLLDDGIIEQGDGALRHVSRTVRTDVRVPPTSETLSGSVQVSLRRAG